MNLVGFTMEKGTLRHKGENAADICYLQNYISPAMSVIRQTALENKKEHFIP